MAHIGKWDIEYESEREEQLFFQTRRLAGFHAAMVKVIFPPEAYESIMGSNWRIPEPRGRGVTGVFGMSLRYACIDEWYKEDRVVQGKLDEDEVNAFAAAWKKRASRDIPLSDEEIFKFYKSNKKDPEERKKLRVRRRKTRRTKYYEKQWRADRNPANVYRKIAASIPNLSSLDEQLLKQISRIIANNNDMLWQAELLKTEDGAVDDDDIQLFIKLHDIVIKNQKQILDLLKQHGYDYQQRRKRREAQTAAQVFEEFTEQASILFEERAVELVCVHCQLSMGYFIRHFPTAEYILTSPSCPRCDNEIKIEWEALPDEVIDFDDE